MARSHLRPAESHRIRPDPGQKPTKGFLSGPFKTSPTACVVQKKRQFTRQNRIRGQPLPTAVSIGCNRPRGDPSKSRTHCGSIEGNPAAQSAGETSIAEHVAVCVGVGRRSERPYFMWRGVAAGASNVAPMTVRMRHTAQDDGARAPRWVSIPPRSVSCLRPKATPV